MVRLLAFFGSLNTSPPPSRTRCSWRFPRRVFASKSMFDQRSPNASPILKPTVREMTCNASNLSPLAAARNARLLRVERCNLFLPDLRRVNPRGRVERYQVEPDGHARRLVDLVADLLTPRSAKT